MLIKFFEYDAKFAVTHILVLHRFLNYKIFFLAAISISCLIPDISVSCPHFEHLNLLSLGKGLAPFSIGISFSKFACILVSLSHLLHLISTIALFAAAFVGFVAISGLINL